MLGSPEKREGLRLRLLSLKAAIEARDARAKAAGERPAEGQAELGRARAFPSATWEREGTRREEKDFHAAVGSQAAAGGHGAESQPIPCRPSPSKPRTCAECGVVKAGEEFEDGAAVCGRCAARMEEEDGGFFH